MSKIYKIKSKIELYPLLSKGYDILECPYCEVQYYPDALTANGTVIYNRHSCKPAYQHAAINRRFEININGELVE